MLETNIGVLSTIWQNIRWTTLIYPQIRWISDKIHAVHDCITVLFDKIRRKKIKRAFLSMWITFTVVENAILRFGSVRLR